MFLGFEYIKIIFKIYVAASDCLKLEGKIISLPQKRGQDGLGNVCFLLKMALITSFYLSEFLKGRLFERGINLLGRGYLLLGCFKTTATEFLL